MIFNQLSYMFCRLSVGISLVVILSGCASGIANPSNMLHEKQYYVTGTVHDQSGSPVTQCRVYLIKRRLAPIGNTKESIDSSMRQYMVNVDASGRYMLMFEPDRYNDLWIGFSDSPGKYEPRVVRINEYMGDSLLEYPGNSPLIINMVLQNRRKKDI